MEMHEIEVHIDRNGQVVIHVRGIAGEACLTTTAALEEALGQVVHREMTPEAYETQSMQIDEQQYNA